MGFALDIISHVTVLATAGPFPVVIDHNVFAWRATDPYTRITGYRLADTAGVGLDDTAVTSSNARRTRRT